LTSSQAVQSGRRCARGANSVRAAVPAAAERPAVGPACRLRMVPVGADLRHAPSSPAAPPPWLASAWSSPQLSWPCA